MLRGFIADPYGQFILLMVGDWIWTQGKIHAAHNPQPTIHSIFLTTHVIRYLSPRRLQE